MTLAETHFTQFAGWNFTFCWFHTPLSSVKEDIYWYAVYQQHFQEHWKGILDPKTVVMCSTEPSIHSKLHMHIPTMTPLSYFTAWAVLQVTQQDSLHPGSFYFQRNIQTPSPDQSLLTTSILFINVSIATCLAVWRSRLQCKWRGTLHQRCHWKRDTGIRQLLWQLQHVQQPNLVEDAPAHRRRVRTSWSYKKNLPPQLICDSVHTFIHLQPATTFPIISVLLHWLIKRLGSFVHYKTFSSSEICTLRYFKTSTKIYSHLLSLSSRWANSTFFSIAFANAAIVL